MNRILPMVLPQPEPLSCLIAIVHSHTAIYRHWAPGDPARCRLCPGRSCTADAFDNCLVLTSQVVPDEEAELFRRQPPAASKHKKR